MDEKKVTTQELLNMIRAGDTELYVRYSSGPEADRNGSSRDWSNGQLTPGSLSVNNLVYQDRVDEYDDFGYWVSTRWTTDINFCEARGLEEWVVAKLREYRFLPGRPWVMRAERVGTDSDNAALIDSSNFDFVGYWVSE